MGPRHRGISTAMCGHTVRLILAHIYFGICGISPQGTKPQAAHYFGWNYGTLSRFRIVFGWHSQAETQGFVSAVIIAISISIYCASTKDSKTFDTPSSDTRSNQVSRYPPWVNLTASLIWSCVCFEYIALCHIMDYSFARESRQVGARKFRQPENTRPGTAPPSNGYPSPRLVSTRLRQAVLPCLDRWHHIDTSGSDLSDNFCGQNGELNSIRYIWIFPQSDWRSRYMLVRHGSCVLKRGGHEGLGISRAVDGHT